MVCVTLLAQRNLSCTSMLMLAAWCKPAFSITMLSNGKRSEGVASLIISWIR
jgi:hypothetical protein